MRMTMMIMIQLIMMSEREVEDDRGDCGEEAKRDLDGNAESEKKKSQEIQKKRIKVIIKKSKGEKTKSNESEDKNVCRNSQGNM